MDQSAVWEKLHGNRKLHKAKPSAISTVAGSNFSKIADINRNEKMAVNASYSAMLHFIYW